MAELKIIRASAGSGKTYSLTEEILKILLSNSDNYFKHLLAVTFTNKATAEMKSRILQELHLLASNQDSNHLSELQKHSDNTETNIRDKAQTILHSILHGYSWFRVETIDTFFQKIIRSFVREIGIAGNYNIELDQEKVLKEAIDRMLDNISEDKDMLSWLLDYIDSKISEGNSWTITNELLSLGKTLFKESLSTKMSQINSLLNQNNFLLEYRNTLYEIIKKYESIIISKAEKALNIIKNNSLEISDFSYGKSGPAGFLLKIKNKNFEAPGNNVFKVLDSEKWAAGKCLRKDDAESIGAEIIAPTITKIIEIIEKDGVDYHTSRVILKNLHIMGLLSRLNDEISNIKEDKSISLISDASPFIHKIINNNDTPFIYEKAGNHFNHILIDEFQDTSSMQWSNFKPLIENSISKDKNCLLVGDVKQSIYRWRSSNWEILESQLNKEFKSILNERNLETNWRSDRFIIEFNNNFFEKAASILDHHLSDNSSAKILPSKIYKDVAQETPKHKQNNAGYINIKVFNKEEVKKVKEEDEEYFSEELIDRINEVLKHGYKAGDIAILIRSKKEGTLLANNIVGASKKGKFIANIGVISNESLFLNNSPTVQLLISAMQVVNAPDSKLNAATLLANYLQFKSNSEETIVNFPIGTFEVEELEKHLGNDFFDKCKELKQESLYGIVEKLSLLFKLYDSDNDLVYIHSFLDLVFDYASSEQSDLNRFLAYWEEEGDKKTISAAESSDAIRILTIHKSKGLQFPVVIVPFASWSIVPKANDKLWLEPQVLPYSKLPILPVNYTKELDVSIFKSDYDREKYLTLIDNLNLLYVAFTRAENILFVFLTDKYKELTTANKLIIDSLNKIDSKLSQNFNKEENRYVFNSINKKAIENNKSNNKIMPSVPPTGTIPMVRINSRASDFMNKEPQQRDPATFGRILHSIMENCITYKDIPMAVQTKVEEGILSSIEGKETIDMLTKAINIGEAKNWFDNKYTVLTEADIISPGGKQRRPDRVMLSNNEAIIVDYKFGQEDDKPKHISQVKDYIQLIQDTGIKHVSGFIWYVTENDIVKVETI